MLLLQDNCMMCIRHQKGIQRSWVHNQCIEYCSSNNYCCMTCIKDSISKFCTHQGIDSKLNLRDSSYPCMMNSYWRCCIQRSLKFSIFCKSDLTVSSSSCRSRKCRSTSGCITCRYTYTRCRRHCLNSIPGCS